MKEIGGYIELDTYSLPMLHGDATALNCGRNCLAYLVHARGIRKIVLPYFLCGSVEGVCRREAVEVRHYHVGTDFRPPELGLEEDEWLYVVNYYGQLDNAVLSELMKKHKRVIVDNAQAYFQKPVEGVDTIYTCRKFFGVADGAFLYTDAVWEKELEQDESYGRMGFLLGRYERGADEFYPEYAANNEMFAGEPVKRMSKLTDNLLHGIEYGAVKQKRTENFLYLHQAFREVNKLKLSVPEGAFMYPLYIEHGAEIREKLVAEKVYVPTLWPDVFAICKPSWREYGMAEDILPLPVDQRYGTEDMEDIVRQVFRYL